MESIKIEKATHLLQGNGDNVRDMHVYSNGRVCVSKWRMTEEELQTLIRNGGEFYVTLFHPPHNFPPMGISVDTPIPSILSNLL